MGKITSYKPKILFIYTTNPGTSYFRMYCFAKKMSELGIADTRFFPSWDADRFFSPNWEEKLEENYPMLEECVSWADFVIVQYISTEEGLSFVEAVRDLKPCFMEIDDYCDGIPHYSVAFDDNKPGGRQNYWAIRHAIEATGVITTTNFLKNHFSKWNKNVLVVPNCIDFDVYDKIKSQSNGKIRIGWIGGASHRGDLKLVKDAILEVINLHPNSEFLVVCPDDFGWEKHDRIHFSKYWTNIEKYPEYLKSLSFDIGIAPLRDNNFNRGKSNLRYLEYSACKIPTVASDIEPFRDAKALLCNSDADWINNLSKLIKDLDFRLQVGWNSYYHVKDNYNLIRVARQYKENLIERRDNYG